MGKIKQGILGGFSGKVANVVGSSWKGIAVMKSLPLSVANPKTAAQLLQRSRFSLLVKIAADILTSTVKPLWDRFAQKMSGFNDFVSTNFDAYFGKLPEPNFGALVISKGKMLAPNVVTGAWTTPTSINVEWESDPSDPYAMASDIPYIVLIDKTDYKAVSVPVGVATRVTGEVTVDLGLTVDSSHLQQVYVAFKRADGTVVSDSANEEVPASA